MTEQSPDKIAQVLEQGLLFAETTCHLQPRQGASSLTTSILNTRATALPFAYTCLDFFF